MSSPLKPLSRPGAGGSTLPPGFLAQTRVPEIYAAVITVTVACTIAVFLRFLCRRMVKAGLWWDDWTMLAALLFEWALSGNLLYDTANLDFCRHIELMQPWQIKPFGKALLLTQLLYYCAQTLIKISLLLLYYRVFGVNKRFRIATYIIGTLLLMWWIASFFATFFQCIPIQAVWDKSITDARCQNIRNGALGTGLSNLVLDILILALPIPMIWHLSVETRVKASLTFVFLLGAFVCATSIIRIKNIFSTDWKYTDLTWDGFGINVWSTVESCCAVIGACLPAMRPLIVRARALTTHGSGSNGIVDPKESTHTGPASSAAISSPPQPKWKSPRPLDNDGPYQSLDEPESDLYHGPESYPMKDSPGFSNSKK